MMKIKRGDDLVAANCPTGIASSCCPRGISEFRNLLISESLDR